MKILLVSSEMIPYAKTGGLADVTAALAAHLKTRGHDVRVVLPFYSSVRKRLSSLEPLLPSLCVQMGTGEVWCGLLQSQTPEGVPLYLVEHEGYFGRDGLYHDGYMMDYGDNPSRFGFFSRAALQLCMDLPFEPDIVHCNDWQTAPTTAYLKNWFWDHPHLGKSASVLTIHNIAYQGVYHADFYPFLGLGTNNFTSHIFESHGAVNFLKGGIHFADAVNTVSPSHAEEITTPHGGFGLAPYLSAKGDAFRGILNGVDYGVWCPQKDPTLPRNYSLEDLSGKQDCKLALQRAFMLEQNPDVCLIGAIGRFVSQKGFQLLRGAIEGILSDMHVQFVILGSGEYDLNHYFGLLPARFGGRAGSFIGYDENLSHLIEAGSDFFLMPSLYEPCGLNQMYSLRYGALPIVHATGGLEDSVEQYEEKTGAGTGFKFHGVSGHTLYNTVGWAVSTYYDRPKHIEKMRRRAMAQDFSWDKRILEYEELYETAREAKSRYDKAHSL